MSELPDDAGFAVECRHCGLVLLLSTLDLSALGPVETLQRMAKLDAEMAKHHKRVHPECLNEKANEVDHSLEHAIAMQAPEVGTRKHWMN